MDIVRLWDIFLIFLKINLLTPSGPASLGILYNETVPRLITEDQFVEVASFSRILPGSDALQLAVFVGYNAAGWRGSLVAALAAILPPTIIMFGVAALISRFRGEQWLSGFVQGVTPALAAMMAVIAINLLKDDFAGNWLVLIIAGISLVAMLLEISPVLVLVVAGIAGAILLR